MNYVPPSASDQQLNGSPPRDPHFRMGRRQGQLSTEFAECRPSRPCAWSGGAIVDARRFCENVSGLGDSMFNLGVGRSDSDEWRTERVVLQERAARMTRVRTGVETGMRGGRCCLRQVREDRTVNVRIRTSRNVLPALWIADRWVHENQIVRLRWRQCRSLGLAMISLSLYSTQVDGLYLKTCGSLPQRVSAGHLPGLALACYHCLLFSCEDGYLIA